MGALPLWLLLISEFIQSSYRTILSKRGWRAVYLLLEFTCMISRNVVGGHKSSKRFFETRGLALLWGVQADQVYLTLLTLHRSPASPCTRNVQALPTQWNYPLDVVPAKFVLFIILHSLLLSLTSLSNTYMQWDFNQFWASNHSHSYPQSQIQTSSAYQ